MTRTTIAFLLVALIIGAASRSGSDVSPRPGLSGAPHATRGGSWTGRGLDVNGGAPPSDTIGGIGSAAIGGTATWYCGGGSPCTHGHHPGELVAAIDRKDTPWDRGDVLRVTSGSRSVTVLVVDVCACAGSRVIDLSRAAFARLADPGRGVIPVVVTEAPPLPATDTDDESLHGKENVA